MTITHTDIATLKQMYHKRYGVELTDEEAVDIGTRLLNFLSVVGKKLSTDRTSVTTK